MMLLIFAPVAALMIVWGLLGLDLALSALRDRPRPAGEGAARPGRHAKRALCPTQPGIAPVIGELEKPDAPRIRLGREDG